MNKLNVLTAAHVGFLHSPDIGATQVTGLHNADLVRAEPVIQRTSELLRTCADSVKPCVNANILIKVEIFSLHICPFSSSSLWS